MISNIQVRDDTGTQRMFDLTTDAEGNVMLVAKIGKSLYRVSLSAVNQAAAALRQINNVQT